MPGQLIQVVGSLLILVPFGLAQLGRLGARSRTSLLLNLAGSSILAGDAAAGSQWGFLLLEGAWAIVSAIGLFRRPRTGLEEAARTLPPASDDSQAENQAAPPLASLRDNGEDRGAAREGHGAPQDKRPKAEAERK